jgi:uncharacterized coiled-coil protein SlyX
VNYELSHKVATCELQVQQQQQTIAMMEETIAKQREEMERR